MHDKRQHTGVCASGSKPLLSGRKAVAAQNAGRYHYIYISGSLNVSKSGCVLDGFYYVKGNVGLSASNIKGTFTIVAEGTIQISSSSMNCTAYSGGLLFFSNGTGLGISGSNSSLGGIIYVPTGQITLSGSGNTIKGSAFGALVSFKHLLEKDLVLDKS